MQTRREVGGDEKNISILIIASAVIYILILYFMLFIGFGRGMVILSEDMLDNFNYWNSVSLVPFKTITQYITTIADGNIKGHAIRNLSGNLFLFFPAGFYLPFFARKMNKIGIYSMVMAAVIIIVELIQLATKSGSLDIDDFILNYVGALIGFIIFTRTLIRALLQFRAW